MKTSAQWREELTKKLSSVDKTRSAMAAVIRRFIVDAMSEDDTSLAIIVRGVRVYPEFETLQAKRDYIQKMSVNREWLEYSCIRAFAAALDVSIQVHAPQNAASQDYRYQSSEPKAAVFHIANFSGAHWSAAVKDEKSGLLDIKPTPGDGNCGAHALYDIWQMHENNVTPTYDDVMDAQIAETVADQVLIDARKKALKQVFDKSKAINAGDVLHNVVVAVVDELSKDVDNQGKPTDLGQFFKKLDATQPLDHVVGSMIARVAVDQESTDLLVTVLTAQNQQGLVTALQKALGDQSSSSTAGKASVVGMFGKSCSQRGRVTQDGVHSSSQAVTVSC